VSHLSLMPQGHVEHEARVLEMVETMEKMGFGNCSNTGACSLACPKEISFENIVRMNREFTVASAKRRPDAGGESGGM
jgi:succinate dehydrogenase / fumarate reductase iron-sulfur subunit